MVILKRPIQHLVTDGRRHLVCLPYSVKYLHMMAAQVGIGKHWFHRDHYDIPVTRRQSIEQAALQVSPKSIVRLIHAHNNPVRTLRMEQGLPSSTAENLDHEARLHLHYTKQGKTGVHYCPSWQYMAIHDKSAEFEACQCDLEKLR